MESLNSVIESNPFHMAPVEIIIPFHNEHSQVAKLIDGIFKTVLDNFYLITLVDDGSTNKNFIKEFNKTPGVRVFRQEKKKGFGAAINLALSNPYQIKINGMRSSIPWVVIMKPGVSVEDNKWLSSLGNTMYKLKTQGVKMISPKTNNANETELIGQKGNIVEDSILEHGFLPMYCAMAHRELFAKVGMMKESDSSVADFAARMKSKGYVQGVCGSSWVNNVAKSND